MRSERVNIDTLDSVSLEERSATFLKIDTQGFEQPVLDGAREFLAKTTGVMLELPVIHVYKRTWSISEALDYMHERGFVLCQAEQNNHHPDDPWLLLSSIACSGGLRTQSATSLLISIAAPRPPASPKRSSQCRGRSE